MIFENKIRNIKTFKGYYLPKVMEKKDSDLQEIDNSIKELESFITPKKSSNFLKRAKQIGSIFLNGFINLLGFSLVVFLIGGWAIPLAYEYFIFAIV